MAGEAGKVGTPPAHYATPGGLQPFDVIDAYELGFFDGNAFRYLVRCGKKGDPLEDLKKARHYIEETILRFESGRLVPPRPTIWGIPTWPTADLVLVSFGLDGWVSRAVEHLLYWRFSKDEGADLRAAERYITRAIKEIGAE